MQAAKDAATKASKYASDTAGSAKDAAGSAAQYASDTAGSAKDTAKDTANAASQYASDTAQYAADTANAAAAKAMKARAHCLQQCGWHCCCGGTLGTVSRDDSACGRDPKPGVPLFRCPADAIAHGVSFRYSRGLAGWGISTCSSSAGLDLNPSDGPTELHRCFTSCSTGDGIHDDMDLCAI